jgi:hypothetical protein
MAIHRGLAQRTVKIVDPGSQGGITGEKESKRNALARSQKGRCHKFYMLRPF